MTKDGKCIKEEGKDDQYLSRIDMTEKNVRPKEKPH